MTNPCWRGLTVDVAGVLVVLALTRVARDHGLSATLADVIRSSTVLFFAVIVARALAYVSLPDPNDNQQAHNLLTVISVQALVVILACAGWLTWPTIGYIPAAIIALWGTLGITMLALQIRDLYRPTTSRKEQP